VKIRFGHCIACDQPIRPPFLSFDAHQNVADGTHVLSWDEADICWDCASKLTVNDMFRLVSAEEEAA
jgi:hypothetical protein